MTSPIDDEQLNVAKSQPLDDELDALILEALGVESPESYVDNKAKFLIDDIKPLINSQLLELIARVEKEIEEEIEITEAQTPTGRYYNALQALEHLSQAIVAIKQEYLKDGNDT